MGRQTLQKALDKCTKNEDLDARILDMCVT